MHLEAVEESPAVKETVAVEEKPATKKSKKDKKEAINLEDSDDDLF